MKKSLFYSFLLLFIFASKGEAVRAKGTYLSLSGGPSFNKSVLVTAPSLPQRNLGNKSSRTSFIYSFHAGYNHFVGENFWIGSRLDLARNPGILNKKGADGTALKLGSLINYSISMMMGFKTATFYPYFGFAFGGNRIKVSALSNDPLYQTKSNATKISFGPLLGLSFEVSKSLNIYTEANYTFMRPVLIALRGLPLKVRSQSLNLQAGFTFRI